MIPDLCKFGYINIFQDPNQLLQQIGTGSFFPSRLRKCPTRSWWFCLKGRNHSLPSLSALQDEPSSARQGGGGVDTEAVHSDLDLCTARKYGPGMKCMEECWISFERLDADTTPKNVPDLPRRSDSQNGGFIQFIQGNSGSAWLWELRWIAAARDWRVLNRDSKLIDMNNSFHFF